MKKRLLIIATLDTKGKEAEYARSIAQQNGIDTILMDVGTMGKPFVIPDISSDAVAEAGRYTLETFKIGSNRSGAVKAMEEGGAILAKSLVDHGIVGGVFGMGGGTGTAIATSIMRTLPFGMPKIVVSTVASRDIRQYIGTKDIVMFHSVADILGTNEFIRHMIGQAVFAVCGMMQYGDCVKKVKPMIGVTAYGVSSACAINAEPLLEEKGYEMIGFHANGIGGMAMEEMIEQGLIVGVLDFTAHELADEMFGGYCKGIGEKRFETAGRLGIPLVFAPGGLDNAVFSPFYPMPDTLKGRRIYTHDVRFCVRMEEAELKSFASIISEKLNKSRGPVHVLIPAKGWSEADRQGMELYDPQLNMIFTYELKKLLRPDIPIEEIDVHISDINFAKRAVAILDEMMCSR